MQIIKKQDGFTLFEMAIGLVIVGLLIAFAAIGFSGVLRSGYEKKTFADMEVIADAMSMYAQRHMRLPCPADPTKIAFGNESTDEDAGVEIGSNENGYDFGTCDTLQLSEGALPYVTLGLPKKYAYDRFGNLLTYRVSVTSAQTPAVAVTQPINSWCMTRPNWFRDEDGDGTEEYVSLAKAAFCCGTFGASAGLGTGPLSDVLVRGPNGASLPTITRQASDPPTPPQPGGLLDEYRLATDPPPPIDELAGTQPPVFPAYILISHGQNGLGAFGSSGTRNIAGMVQPELENVFTATFDPVLRVYNTSDRLSGFVPADDLAGGVNLFRDDIDDIVFWETPAQVLGRLGGVSCSRP